jgi:hypothetical protein
MRPHPPPLPPRPPPPCSHMYTGTSVIATQTGIVWLRPWGWRIITDLSVYDTRGSVSESWIVKMSEQFQLSVSWIHTRDLRTVWDDIWFTVWRTPGLHFYILIVWRLTYVLQIYLIYEITIMTPLFRVRLSLSKKKNAGWWGEKWNNYRDIRIFISCEAHAYLSGTPHPPDPPETVKVLPERGIFWFVYNGGSTPRNYLEWWWSPELFISSRQYLNY